MNCHQQIWVGAETLAPVRESWKTGTPIRWKRVHNLPGFVYFAHNVHVSKGVGCVECHGRLDRMPLTWQVQPLTMAWCLECHRNPGRHLRPEGEVYSMTWTAESEARADTSAGDPTGPGRAGPAAHGALPDPGRTHVDQLLHMPPLTSEKHDAQPP